VSPSGGRPTRRIPRSRGSDASGTSLNSILRVVRRAFAPARAARADEADLFGIIVTSAERVGPPSALAVRRSSQSEVASFIGGMRKVGAVQCLGIQEDCHGEVEADAMLLRVGSGLLVLDSSSHPFQESRGHMSRKLP
jgi:hypothetical protein